MDWVGKLPPWLAAIALLVIAVAFLFIAVGQPERFEFAGLGFGKQNEGAFAAVPSGAVVAFDDTSLREDECLPGWTPFEPGHGRTIIGAGTGEGLARREFRDKGGVEKHALIVEELAPHGHELKARFAFMNASGGTVLTVENFAVGRVEKGLGKKNQLSDSSSFTETKPTGQGKPHENMPPFIALFYCRKD